MVFRYIRCQEQVFENEFRHFFSPAFGLTLCESMCSISHMPTNLAINDKLLQEALKLGGFKTKKETVNKALESFVKSQRRKGILRFAGKIDYDPKYDYKKARSRR